MSSVCGIALPTSIAERYEQKIEKENNLLQEFMQFGIRVQFSLEGEEWARSHRKQDCAGCSRGDTILLLFGRSGGIFSSVEPRSRLQLSLCKLY